MKKCMNMLTLGVAVTLSMIFLSGCATYVDTRQHSRVPKNKVTIENPQPVYVKFHYISGLGINDSVMTELLKTSVLNAVYESGLFSQVNSFPTPNEGNAGTLTIIMDEKLSGPEFLVKIGQAFVTVGTVFIVGSHPYFRYECTIDYLPSGDTPQITRTLEGGWYRGLGLIRFPPRNARKTGGLGDNEFIGIQEMAYQVVINGLNELAQDKNFH